MGKVSGRVGEREGIVPRLTYQRIPDSRLASPPQTC